MAEPAKKSKTLQLSSTDMETIFFSNSVDFGLSKNLPPMSLSSSVCAPRVVPT